MLQFLLWYVFKIMAKLAFLAFLGWLYKELTMGICKCQKNIESKVVVITGATSGIGFETAIQLAKKGAKIIMGCRNLAKAEMAKKKIETRVFPDTNADVTILELDLACLKSISRFVSDVEDLTSCVHILVNNAGTFFMERDKFGNYVKKLSQDGFELIMGTNYLGHFYLTHQMLDLLKNGGTLEEPSRIVNVSFLVPMMGLSHFPMKLDFNPQTASYNPMYQYFSSKMAIQNWTNRLARKLKKVNVISVNVNPGLVRTAIYSDIPKWERFIVLFFCWIFGKNSEQGAHQLIHACLVKHSPNISDNKNTLNGKYLSDCRTVKDHFHYSKKLQKSNIEDAMWDYTTDILSMAT